MYKYCYLYVHVIYSVYTLYMYLCKQWLVVLVNKGFPQCILKYKYMYMYMYIPLIIMSVSVIKSEYIWGDTVLYMIQD